VVESSLEENSETDDKTVNKDLEYVYGSEFFSTTNLNFAPNENMVTPETYVLGVGDEIQILIYGMQEYSGDAKVTKEGKINIPVVGQIHVAGLTYGAAKTQIKK